MTEIKQFVNLKPYILSVLVICLLIVCFKPKTLSGVWYESVGNQDAKSNTTFDFRTDGTVIYNLRLTTSTFAWMREEGKGTFIINGNKVTAITRGTQEVSGLTGWKTTNQWIFRIDGEDLIILSKNGSMSDSKRLWKK